MSKNTNDFRDYNGVNPKIINFYKENHTNQTYEFAQKQIKKYCTNFDTCKMNIWEAIDKLDNIVDDSDPDMDEKQIFHAFQTAEALRAQYPEHDWLHLVGLIHDLGKVLVLPEFGSNKQWSVVGDTFPLGCNFSEEIIYHNFFENNIDLLNDKYSTKLGIYKENCGLDNVLFSFGHDEYLYRILVHNGCTIPDIGLKIIRYHSFYSWHKNGAYQYLMNDFDFEVKKWCQIFSDCDLYSKNNYKLPDIENLKYYYNTLLDKYLPKQNLNW